MSEEERAILLGRIAMLTAALDGVRGMAQQEAEHGNAAWRGAVDVINQTLSIDSSVKEK